MLSIVGVIRGWRLSSGGIIMSYAIVIIQEFPYLMTPGVAERGLYRRENPGIFTTPVLIGTFAPDVATIHYYSPCLETPWFAVRLMPISYGDLLTLTFGKSPVATLELLVAD
ncbi:hypothetical protein [Microbispora rosea]|uniref:hypothetical protein n=1 Tax=Microbispora rosea TaxID=58117 RepID=UPI003D8C8FBA